jgi:hypothetical protein
MLSRWGANLFWYNLNPFLDFRNFYANFSKYNVAQLLIYIWIVCGFSFFQNPLGLKLYLTRSFRRKASKIKFTDVLFKDYVNKEKIWYKAHYAKTNFFLSRLWIFIFRNRTILFSYLIYPPFSKTRTTRLRTDQSSKIKFQRLYRKFEQNASFLSLRMWNSSYFF